MTEDQKKMMADFAARGLEFGKDAMHNVSGPDKELLNLLVDVPKISPIYAVPCALANLILSGTGTFAAGCLEKGAWNKT